MNEIKFPKHIDLFAVPKSTAADIVKAAAENFYKEGYLKGHVDGYKEGYKNGYLIGGTVVLFGALGGYFIAKGLIRIASASKEVNANGSESVQRELKCVETADDCK